MTDDIIMLEEIQDKVRYYRSKKVELQSEVTRLSAENSRLAEVNETLKKTHENLYTDIKDIKGKVEIKTKELADYVSGLENRESGVEALQEKVKQDNKAIAKLRGELNLSLEESRTQMEIYKNEQEAIAEERKVLAKEKVSLGKTNAESAKVMKEWVEKLKKAEKKEQDYADMLKIVTTDREIIAGEKEKQARITHKLIEEKDNIQKHKAALTIQMEECDVEIEKATRKQASLDKSLEELENEKNRAEILKLKVEKIIMDNKDIKELAELRKELNK